MRLIEIALFLSPFVAFAVLRLVLPARGLPAWVLPVFAASVAVMLGLLLYLRSLDAGDAEQTYVPARLENGQVVPGHPERR
ncbi:MAG: hypothetical protein JSS43_12745 [Proteobacteria bacterium]|nr:hypothetical protein [Pseudomonadota bacterium]